MAEACHTAVVGAGPAGAAAAHVLASEGHDVVLIDKATFPRDKFCGDGLTTLALRRLDEMAFDPATVVSWTPVRSAWLRSPRGRHHLIDLPDGPGLWAAVARRSDLDAALVDHAAAAGARLRLGHAVTAVRPDSAEVRLSLADGSTITAAHCIAADGMWSPVRKMLGLDTPGYRGEWHAFRQYFSDVGPTASTELCVWFEPDLLPGYMWSFPLGGRRANVGFGILRGGTTPTQRMKTLWPELLARRHVRDMLGHDAEPEAPHRAWPIPARIDQATLSGPRTLFVGDAAAACDTLTGEGIGQALQTGRDAASALLANPHSFDEARTQYETSVRTELVADHKMSVLLGRLMATPRIAEASLRAAGATDWTRRQFGRWMFEDYPRALIATPRRWRRGMFSPPGAYEDRAKAGFDAEVLTSSSIGPIGD